MKLVENAARRHGHDTLVSYLGGIPEEHLRRLGKLKKEARQKGISINTVFDFFELMTYSKQVTSAQPQHKGCVTDMVIAGSSIALFVQDLFNGGDVQCKDGVRLNGIFGKQGIVRTEADLATLNDLMPFMYIISTSMNHGFSLPVYFLFFGETPNPVSVHSHPERSPGDRQKTGRVFLENNSGPWFNAKLILARMQKFMDDAGMMCLEVIQHPPGVIFCDGDGKPRFVPVITVLYDIEAMTMWRVEHNHGHIAAQRMEEYLEEHIDFEVYPGLSMFSRKEVVSRHIERLHSHSSHGDEGLAAIRMNSFKKVGCVDGRTHNNCSELGSMLNEREFEAILLDSHTTHINMVFHTECGYVYTAITLHKLFNALRIGIKPNDRVTHNRAVAFINMTMKSPWVSRSDELFNDLIRHVDLSRVSSDPKVQKQVRDDLHSLFTDNAGTLRYATPHMMDRGLFVIEEGFPVMTATKNVEAALHRHGIEMPTEDARVLVVEEIARIDQRNKQAWVEAKADEILRYRIDETLPVLTWEMEDLVTSRNYLIPPKMALEQTKEELSNTKRQDKHTHVWFELSRPGRILPDHLAQPETDETTNESIDLFLHRIGQTDSSRSGSPPASSPKSHGSE